MSGTTTFQSYDFLKILFESRNIIEFWRVFNENAH